MKEGWEGGDGVRFLRRGKAGEGKEAIRKGKRGAKEGNWQEMELERKKYRA